MRGRQTNDLTKHPDEFKRFYEARDNSRAASDTETDLESEEEIDVDDLNGPKKSPIPKSVCKLNYYSNLYLSGATDEEGMLTNYRSQ